MIQDSQSNPDWFTAQRIVPAIVLIAVGGIFLLSNLHLLRVHDIWEYWPVILMVMGVFKLVDADDARERTSGGILLAVGSIFLADNMGLIPFNVWDLWPLLLIGAGVYMLVDRTTGGSGMPFHIGISARGGRGFRGRNWTRREAAVFSGGKRKIVVDDFQSAKYDAVFGGFEIDLRGSQIQGDSATLEINAVFGGAEVKIPTNWSVVMQGAGVFGAFVDSAEQPNPAVTPNIKRLFVRGAAVFGGVEIKN
jgi:predicted membrane protein